MLGTSLNLSTVRILHHSQKDDVDFNVGDHVSHPDFGEGVVVMVDKSLVTIAFPHPYGVKKMMKNHKSLTKL